MAPLCPTSLLRRFVQVSLLTALVGWGCTPSPDEPAPAYLEEDFVYPSADPDASRISLAASVALTDRGLFQISRSIPNMFRSGCERGSLGTCEIVEGQPNQLQFPLDNFDAIQPGGTITLDSASAQGNIRLRLVDNDPVDGIELIVGCDYDDCDEPDKFVYASANFTVDAGGATCQVYDDPSGNYGLAIRSLRGIFRPQVVPGPDGAAHLVIDADDLQLEALDVESALTVDSVLPGCTDECFTCTAMGSATEIISSPLAEIVGPFLLELFTETLFEQLSVESLTMEAGVLPAELIPALNPSSSPVGLAVGASASSTRVSTPDSGRGPIFHVDIDAGFVANYNTCVRETELDQHGLPAPPVLNGTVPAVDPVTAELRPEDYDLSITVADAMVNRAAYALFNSGSLCAGMSAEDLGRWTKGRFVPTISLFSLVAPGLADYGPPEAPVDIRIRPNTVPYVEFGTGEGNGDDYDSHLKALWRSVDIELYADVDGSPSRVLVLRTDLKAHVSAHPSYEHNLSIMIDEIALDNIHETYNEMLAPVDAVGLGNFVEALLPLFLGEEPIEIDIPTDRAGFVFVPKLRAVQRSPQGRHLSLFVRFCTDADVINPNDGVCYEPSQGPGRTPQLTAATAHLVRGPDFSEPESHGAAVEVSVGGSVPEEHLEVGYRVDGGGWFGFKRPEGGTYILESPRLAWPGEHVVEVMVRDRRVPDRWIPANSLEVRVDRTPPRLVGEREGGQVVINAWDDETPPERLVTFGKIIGPYTERAVGMVHRTSIALADNESLELYARDESGMTSRPLRIFPETPMPRAINYVPHTGASRAAGCTAGTAPIWVTPWFVLLIFFRLRRRPV